jgi:hypothetical protein
MLLLILVIQRSVFMEDLEAVASRTEHTVQILDTRELEMDDVHKLLNVLRQVIASPLFDEPQKQIATKYK